MYRLFLKEVCVSKKRNVFQRSEMCFKEAKCVSKNRNVFQRSEMCFKEVQLANRRSGLMDN